MDDITIIIKELEKLQVLVRTNNLILSRFIMELATVKKDLGLPKRKSFFRFELLNDEYETLVNEYGREKVDKALFRLDRLLLTNKQECPNNIAKYIRRKMEKSLYDAQRQQTKP